MATSSTGSPKSSADDKSPIDQAVDAFVYAPVGLALELLDQVPGWVARGKSQVTLGRLFAKMAVEKGQNEVGDAVSDVLSDVFGVDLKGADTSAKESAVPASSKASPKEPADSDATTKSPASKVKASSPKGTTSSPKPKQSKAKNSKSKTSNAKTSNAKTSKPKAKATKPKATKTKAAKPKPAKAKATKPKAKVSEAGDLGLESYDTLSASQIVKRLDSLSATQLESVRLHEEAGRHRVTVLNRIRQIQRAD